ncbi:prolipoprotein diacylglyceryl transferase [Cyclobacterium amurskyense]|uniref:Phosphatidylglycerol--prolipoprotein diacylglyceryl transferase n=1 Tax=Cyclobacterium amurskyense TaxID=320787 RepID=A0A0H4PA04_9BACT|nr:prolipoprotein diacylglyceryl transferase [Cyclobacterium amurskyense]AKP49955.1 Prolipoprotein diacylglyceryl transferase [Cyclobacterium amurskyense]|tara:strand:- start:15059 stop:16165 length:1107 start_codon:yes stop_codon:yes gene_type:complete
MINSILYYVVWSPNPSIFSGFDRLRWYSLLFAMGFIISQQFMIHFFKKEGHDENLVDKLTIYMVLATIIGARLGHVLFYEPERYLSNPIDILKVWEGGLASHGAAISILIALWLYARRTPGQSYLWVVDRIVIVVALTGALIRFGNLMNSEIGGKATGTDSGFVFARETEEILNTMKLPITSIKAYKPLDRQAELTGTGRVPVNFDIEIEKGSFDEANLKSVLERDVKYALTRFNSSKKYMAEDPETPLNLEIRDQGDHYLAVIKTFGQAKYPTQIYESLTYLLIFILLFLGWKKYKSEIPEGLYLGLFLISVFGMRFVWEFFKENQVEFEDSLTFNMGQALSIPLVVIGFGLIFYSLNNKRKQSIKN